MLVLGFGTLDSALIIGGVCVSASFPLSSLWSVCQSVNQYIMPEGETPRRVLCCFELSKRIFRICLNFGINWHISKNSERDEVSNIIFEN